MRGVEAWVRLSGLFMSTCSDRSGTRRGSAVAREAEMQRSDTGGGGGPDVARSTPWVLCGRDPGGRGGVIPCQSCGVGLRRSLPPNEFPPPCTWALPRGRELADAPQAQATMKSCVSHPGGLAGRPRRRR